MKHQLVLFRAILLPTCGPQSASKRLSAWVVARAAFGRPRGPDASTNQMETVTSDEQMDERALSGEPEAFGELVRRWGPRIFALSFGMLGRAEDARDATQETFLEPFRTFPF